MKLIIATGNENKIKEIKAKINGLNIDLLSLKDINFKEELPETQNTIEGNSEQKANYLFNKTNLNCFADDTGLLIEELNNEPGVYSARYAGKNANAENNMNLVLKKLENSKNRKAKFVTVITLILNNQKHQFKGEVRGIITSKKSGKKGFGYDPIFKPEGYNYTFSEMTLDEKNKISHRAIAVEKLITFLKNL